MWFKKDQLDTPMNEIYGLGDNTETLREYIANSEKEFGMSNINVDNLTELELNNHVRWLDELWYK